MSRRSRVMIMSWKKVGLLVRMIYHPIWIPRLIKRLSRCLGGWDLAFRVKKFLKGPKKLQKFSLMALTPL